MKIFALSIIGKFPLVAILLVLPLSALAKDDLHLFTNNDMYALSHKLGESLRQKCKQLQTDSNVSVEFENSSELFINNSQFIELIQSEVAGKTNLIPSSTPPSFELETQLHLEKKSSHNIKQYIYTLAAVLFQADETLCKTSVKLIKSNEIK